MCLEMLVVDTSSLFQICEKDWSRVGYGHVIMCPGTMGRDSAMCRFSGSHELCVCSWGFVGLSQRRLHFCAVEGIHALVLVGKKLNPCEFWVPRCSLAPVMN